MQFQRTRFAPSPTGYLHLGHVAHMIHVWGMARARNAQVVLRIEDHDRTRCKPEYEHAILDDLRWLGFQPDLPTLDAFGAAPSDFRQSDCNEHYAQALEQLVARGLVYACSCSRKDIAARVGAAHEETPYDNHCRTRGLPMDAPNTGLRVQLPDDIVEFDDEYLGPQRQHPQSQCGDVLIRDRHGCWTYQFAVTVDDMRHDIDYIVRGADLLASAGRQVLLAQLLGRSVPPAFAHHRLLTASGRKLSKRDFAKGICELRIEGRAPQRVLGEAAYAAGLISMARDLDIGEIPRLFA